LGYSNNYGQITAEVIRRATQGSYDSTPWQIETCEPARSSEQYAELADSTVMHGNAGTDNRKNKKSQKQKYNNKLQKHAQNTKKEKNTIKKS